MNKKDIETYDDVVIDLGDYGAAQPAIETISISGLDTITLNSSMYDTGSLTSSSVISFPSTYTTNSTGISYTNTPTYTFNSTFSDPIVNIDSDGVNIKEGGDLKIGNTSLKEFMTKMEQRLAILVPDPAKLEKFEALKKAYEHYKTMEKLCFDEPDKEEN
jgi:hypothetical protein